MNRYRHNNQESQCSLQESQKHTQALLDCQIASTRELPEIDVVIDDSLLLKQRSDSDVSSILASNSLLCHKHLPSPHHPTPTS